MNKLMNISDRHFQIIIWVITLLIAISLAVSTYYINYWPTDSYNPYIPTASRLFEKPYLSQMHTIAVEGILRITMRSKEALIFGIALMQRLLSDYKTLYPNIFLLIISTSMSSLLFYYIFRKLFDPKIGLFAYMLYTFCFWPYMYVLQGAHQPLVLMNFLLATIFFLYSGRYRSLYFLSGLFFGLMFFSSPTASLYLFYFLGIAIYKLFIKDKRTLSFSIFIDLFLFLFGCICVFLIFTIPDPIYNFSQFVRFLNFSQEGNNFVIYKNYLTKFFPMPEVLRGGGLYWILKYFILIMPTVFPIYAICLFYLLRNIYKKPSFILIILLSLSTPILVELSGVAQFGRNYYSWLPGMIFATCFVLYSTKEVFINSSIKLRRTFLALFILILISHVGYNSYIFFGDVFPSRMANTKIHDWLINNGQDSVYVYSYHPRNKNFTIFLNNPKQKNKLKLIKISNIRQAKSGYIFIPPITGFSILEECRLGDYSLDLYLTELFNSRDFEKYVAASFKTLASSKLWNQEEEICTYLDLILNKRTDVIIKKGHAYILDATKLQKERFSSFPRIAPVRF